MTDKFPTQRNCFVPPHVCTGNIRIYTVLVYNTCKALRHGSSYVCTGNIRIYTVLVYNTCKALRHGSPHVCTGNICIYTVLVYNTCKALRHGSPYVCTGNICIYTVLVYNTCKALRHGSVLPAITPWLPLPRKHSLDGASTDWGSRHIIAAYYSFIYPERTKGWVGLIGWPIVGGLPT